MRTRNLRHVVTITSRKLMAIGLLAFSLAIFSRVACGQTQGSPSSPGALKKLSVEELLDLEVISVSRHPERLSETASAIQVITQEDIRRSGATRLPEALRLASNLEVAQLGSRQWAISARGFNSTTANKLLVLIDGRTIYTPLYSGVFWDVQDVLLEDIERIEVISGPGATLWGANAVNGVINIITKVAKDSQGVFLEGGGGSEMRGFGGMRYDGRIAQPGNSDIAVSGGNVIGRWSHTISDNSDFKLQLYYDRTDRNIPGTFAENLDTYDVDFQHRFLQVLAWPWCMAWYSATAPGLKSKAS